MCVSIDNVIEDVTAVFTALQKIDQFKLNALDAATKKSW
jgi:hypothetical protein